MRRGPPFDTGRALLCRSVTDQLPDLTAARALPPPGMTVPGRVVVGTPGASGDLLTVAEAAKRYDVSLSKMRRKLAEGRLPGAVEPPMAGGGESWEINPLAQPSAVFGPRQAAESRSAVESARQDVHASAKSEPVNSRRYVHRDFLLAEAGAAPTVMPRDADGVETNGRLPCNNSQAARKTCRSSST